MPDDLFFARAQMGLSLGFHILFAVMGMGMPVLMAVSEGLFLRTGDPDYRELSRRWARGTAILFAVGAVSGTVLSFELGLLWPRFMAYAGGIIGMPFSLEGFAFFTEAIFLGVYLYGWERLSPRVHWLAGVVVAISGAFSAIFVVTANAWMNAPTGFRYENGVLVDVDPLAAMLNRAALQQVVHMLLAAYVSCGFAVAAIHAYFLRRGSARSFHRKALRIALLVSFVTAPLQMLSGDRIAKMTAQIQPAKFAAMEGLYETQPAAPLTLGGWPDNDARTVRFGLEIPYALSFLAHGDPQAPVTGLNAFPPEDWPNPVVTHLAFDVMVGCGTVLFVLALWGAASWLRRRRMPEHPRFLAALVVAGPLGFIALEAGWTVTEVGRQPWIIYGVLRTAAAVTSQPGLAVPFVVFTLLYLFLSVVVIFLLRRQFLETSPTVSSPVL